MLMAKLPRQAAIVHNRQRVGLQISSSEPWPWDGLILPGFLPVCGSIAIIARVARNP